MNQPSNPYRTAPHDQRTTTYGQVVLSRVSSGELKFLGLDRTQLESLPSNEILKILASERKKKLSDALRNETSEIRDTISTFRDNAVPSAIAVKALMSILDNRDEALRFVVLVGTSDSSALDDDPQASRAE